MQAVIACGGRGTRMYPLTRDVPKCMLPVAGVPFIDHVITALRDDGFDNIILLVSHLGEQVVKWCKDGARYGVDVRYSWDDGTDGVQGALREAYELLDDTLLLTYGDTWLNADYAAPLRLLRSANYDCVMSMWPHDGHADLKANAAVDGLTCRFSQPGDVPRFVEAGMTAYRKKPHTEDPEVFAFRLDGFERPYEIGSPEGYALTRRRLATTKTIPYHHVEAR